MQTTPQVSSPYTPLVIEEYRPLRVAAVKSTGSANMNAGTALTLLDTTGTPGPGNIEQIQIYVSNLTGGDQLACSMAQLRVFIDGESTASIYMPLSQLFFCYASMQGNNNPANYTYATENVACDRNQSFNDFGGFRNLFIPYNTSVKVQLVNFSSTNNTLVDSQVIYRSGVIPAWRTGTRRKRLRQSTCFSYTPTGQYDGFTGVNALANQDLINVTPNVPGELESVGLLIWNGSLSTSDAPLEGPIDTYIDGTLLNQYLGSEDYFYNQVYGAQMMVQTPHGGISYRGPIRDVGGHGSQWWKLMGRVPHTHEAFNSSVRINWTNGIAAVPSLTVNIVWHVLYYTAN